jgi:Zn-dependent metalloprotease
MTRTGSRTVTGLTVFALASVTACSSGADPRDPIATQPVRHLEVNLALAGQDLTAAAPAYVASLQDELDLGLSAADEYRVVATARGRDGLRHARLQQVHAGVPVLGAEIVVHADETTFTGLNGYVTRHLDGFDVTPAIDESVALATARAERAGDATISFDEASALVIMPRAEGGATLAWRVELRNQPQDGLAAGRWIYFVDAESGAVARSFDALTTEQASGPGGNQKKARTWSAELDVEPMDGQFAMETTRLETYDMAGGMDLPPMTVRGPLDPIGDAAINDAHGYAEITLNMMRDWYGHNSIDDNGFVIVSRVHFDMSFENAFWDGTQMTYGDGAEKFYPLSGSVDVVAHEINHGFTEFHSNLEYAGMSGGLNESFSDIAGTLAETYIDGDTADFTVGEDIFRADGALRYMCDPRADRAYYKEEYGVDDVGSIDHASDFTRDIDVHFSSGVPNKAFCLAVGRFRATSSGGSAVEAMKKVGAAWYLANASYWSSATDFTAGCQGVIDAARALGFSSEEVAALSDSWADVGVNCEGQTTSCDDDGECEIDAGETCASCAGDCDACSEECGWFKKLKCKVGIGDCSRCDAPAGCGDGVCAEDEDDESCGQDCGCAAADSCGSVAPYGCWCDDACEATDDCCADVDDC